MSALGIVLIVAGVVLFFWGPRSLNISVKRTGLRIRGLAGPILVILGILVLTGVIN